MVFDVAVTRTRQALLALAVFLPALASAQPSASRRVTLVGSVVDSLGRAIPGVDIRLIGTALAGRTNDSGGFRISNVPTGAARMFLRHFSYEQATVELDVKADAPDSVVIALNANATEIAAMNVEEISRSKRLLRGFWDRQEQGIGNYLTRDQIDKSNAHTFMDLLRVFPTVHVLGAGDGARLQMARAPRGCAPLFWVDNMRMENADPSSFLRTSIEAIEVYGGVSTIPLQFQPRENARPKTCGVIVVWTRLPGT